MKIEVNIQKKHFVGFVVFGLFILGIVGVIAFDSDPANPLIFGHSLNELDWSKAINSSINVSGNVNAPAFCMWNGTDSNCISSWPTGGGGVTRIIAGSGIIVNPAGGTGDVTINATSTGGGTIPSGAVMFFNLASCPAGWTEMTAARGRYIVGLVSGGTLGGTAGTALTNRENRATGAHVHQYTRTLRTSADADSQGSGNFFAALSSPQDTTAVKGGAVAGTNAPYIQLLACVKQ